MSLWQLSGCLGLDDFLPRLQLRGATIVAAAIQEAAANVSSTVISLAHHSWATAVRNAQACSTSQDVV